MKRTLALAMAIALALSAAAGAAQGNSGNVNYVGTMVVVNCEAWVSLREHPDTRAERLAQVPLGAWVTDCTQFDERFVYGAYDGVYGFILDEYLAPAGIEEGGEDGIAGDGADPSEVRPGTVMVEGEAEDITERLYESGMGFSMWYAEGAFGVVDDMYESDSPSFYMEGRIDLADAYVIVEFLSPEITGASGEAFFEETFEQYGAELPGEPREGETEGGASWRAVGAALDDGEITLYRVHDGAREVQVVATYSLEAVEAYRPLVDRIVQTIAFDA